MATGGRRRYPNGWLDKTAEVEKKWSFLCEFTLMLAEKHPSRCLDSTLEASGTRCEGEENLPLLFPG